MKDPSNFGPREFATTHWSLVVAAKADEASRTRARKALEELCRAYWYPLYAFVRYRGYSPDDAQDLAQDTFVKAWQKLETLEDSACFPGWLPGNRVKQILNALLDGRLIQACILLLIIQVELSDLVHTTYSAN